MGCVHGKCCCRCRCPCPRSSDGDKADIQELGTYSGHVVPVPSHNFRLEYSVLTQPGYYPDAPDKENQDSFCIRTNIQGNPNAHFFGVFDGHGTFGTQCSNFVKNRLVEILSDDPMLLNDPVKAYNSAFLATNDELHNSDIDDSICGTTAITVLVVGDILYVANVGDSRAVIAVKDGNRTVAEDLSHDQTPFRKDECERVKLCGARVLSVDQVEGLKDPSIQTWGDEETEGDDPPRLWVQNGMYPGTAFTRSVGDRTAETIGVVAVPEVSMVQLTPNHPFFIVASDGVFEFLSSQTVVDMVSRYADPRDASSAIAGESYKLWLEHENRTDDITIIIVHIKDLSNSGVYATDGCSGVNGKSAALTIGKGTDVFVTPPGSEFYRSVRSDFSDLQPCQHIISTDQSPEIVPPLPRPLEL
uniref:protein-serine/threonine phosphatase n=1 Tax=Davidia involucrata TaxID=16924 RepID=A0A5B6YRB3_DAVIN